MLGKYSGGFQAFLKEVNQSWDVKGVSGMKKKLFTFLTAVLVTASLVAVPAMANDHGDSSFGFDFANSQESDTDYRLKEDTTSAYMSCTSSSGEYYYAWVYGYYNGYIWDASVDTNGNSHHYEFTDTGTQQTQWMVNWVKENANLNGWSTVYAKIHGEKCIPSHLFYAEGVWSPDSV